MQISTEDAVKFGFILDKNGKNFDPYHYKNKSSFDLSIREVLNKDIKTGDVISSDGKSVILNPQDSAYLISEEIIRIPQDYIAYVFLKNRQSQKGLLALNTGIIDGGYYGVISTLITNLSSEMVIIPDNTEQGNLFFRVVFHKNDNNLSKPESKLYPKKCRDYEEYKKLRINDLKKFPTTFLDVESVKDGIRNRIKQELSSFNITRLGAIIAVLGVLFSVIPIARDYYFTFKVDNSKWINQTLSNKENILNLSKEIEVLKSENKKLKDKIKKIN